MLQTFQHANMKLNMKLESGDLLNFSWYALGGKNVCNRNMQALLAVGFPCTWFLLWVATKHEAVSQTNMHPDTSHPGDGFHSQRGGTPESLTGIAPEKVTGTPKGKDHLPTIVLQGLTVKLPGNICIQPHLEMTWLSISRCLGNVEASVLVEEVFEGQAHDISRCHVLIVNMLLVRQQKGWMFFFAYQKYVYREKHIFSRIRAPYTFSPPRCVCAGGRTS